MSIISYNNAHCIVFPFTCLLQATLGCGWPFALHIRRSRLPRFTCKIPWPGVMVILGIDCTSMCAMTDVEPTSFDAEQMYAPPSYVVIFDNRRSPPGSCSMLGVNGRPSWRDQCNSGTGKPAFARHWRSADPPRVTVCMSWGYNSKTGASRAVIKK